MVILYLTVSSSLPLKALEFTFTLEKESSGRSFLISTVFSRAVATVSDGQVGVAVEQVTPVTVSVAKTLRFLGASQAISALAFCIMLIPNSKN